MMNTVQTRASPQVWSSRHWDPQESGWPPQPLSPNPSMPGSRRSNNMYWEAAQMTPIFLTPPNTPIPHSPLGQRQYVFQTQAQYIPPLHAEAPKPPAPKPQQQAQYAGHSFGSKEVPPPQAEEEASPQPPESNKKPRSHYEILGVEKTCTEQELKKAYKKLAVKLHPDKNPNDPNAQQRFSELNEAFSVLSDPVKREEYEKEMAGSGDAGWGWNAEAAKRNAANYQWSGDEMLFQIGGQLNNARYRARHRRGFLSCFSTCLGD